jgi:CheY-like chemotaxis protein
MRPDRVSILCVDDEPNVLEGLSLMLRRRYDVVTAPSGAAGLEALQKRSMAVVISDMRMPGMDGATFLSRSREAVPDAVRILLTGQSELESAIAAVNQGQIFRFLTKPCPPPLLVATVDAAAEQHRLLTGEKVLLEQTLRGCIKALTDVLALASPAAFGRATRIRQHVSDLVSKMQMGECWQLDVAAMLCQLGSIALPADTASKVYYGQPLTAEETQMVSRMPAVTEQLLGSIPRLETVLAILAGHTKPFKALDPGRADAEKTLASRGAEILKVAADFESLEAQGQTVTAALDAMRGQTGRYDPAVLKAFVELRGGAASVQDIVRSVPLSALRVGMVFAEDLKMEGGVLLAARGYRVTSGFVERMRNFRQDSINQMLRVIDPHADGTAEPS